MSFIHSDTPEHCVAFFDMDGTILSVNSAKLWALYMYRIGEIGKRDMLKSLGWLMRYKMAMVNMSRVTQEVSKHIIGVQEQQMAEHVARWYDEEIRQFILPQVVQLVVAHQQAGHKVVLLTAASPYISTKLADDLNLDGYLCTRFEVSAGYFTGQFIEPLCYGEGKIHWAQSWCDTHDFSLEDAFFYTDSFTDVPLMRKVKHPVAINPDRRLRRWALRQNVAIADYC